MYQALSVLQMSAEELDDYLENLSLENPLLEAKPAKKPIESRVLAGRCGYVKKHDGESLDLPLPDRSEQTLADFLEDQIITMRLDGKTEKLLHALIINLDDNGFLTRDTKSLISSRTDTESLAAALETLRSLEPAGVGAEDVSDCLCIQLERSGEKNSHAYLICRSYLEHLAKNHINHIAKALNISESEVIEAKARIYELNPLPSNGFGDGSSHAVIIPDIILEFEEGEPVLYTTEDYLPSYNINSMYSNMAKSTELNEDERSYFKDKLEKARTALSCVKHRRETLLSCAEKIVNEQWEFFCENGPVRPLQMSEMANSLGVHLSTVSRAVKNKYISCRRGCFPLSYFFASEPCGDTADEIVKAIRAIIAGEDPKHPLSDSRICDILTDRGYEIARRTVAKYREKGGIPPATGRKQR